MSILVDQDTRVIVQGATGRDGSFHALSMLDYGTYVVAGVTPGKAGQKVGDIDVLFCFNDLPRLVLFCIVKDNAVKP